MGRIPGAYLTLQVLDASVAIAWYVPSQSTLATVALLRPDDSPQWRVPACFDFEVVNVLLQYERRGVLGPGLAEIALADLKSLGVQSESAPDPGKFIAAIDLARRYRVSLFDAFYLLLALKLDAPLVTRDERLAAAGELEVCAVQYVGPAT